jgi:hypothetical protein
MPEPSEVPPLSRAPRAKGPFTSLPERIRLEDTTTTEESSPPPDPAAGRDPDRDFMLRHSG